MVTSSSSTFQSVGGSSKAGMVFICELTALEWSGMILEKGLPAKADLTFGKS